MSEQDKQDAKLLAARAAKQSKQAAKNTGRAAKVAAPIAAEKVGDAAEKVNDVAEDTVEAAVRTTHKFSPRVLSRISGDTGVGFLALSVAIYAGAIAVNKFGSAYSQRTHVVRSTDEMTRLRKVA